MTIVVLASVTIVLGGVLAVSSAASLARGQSEGEPLTPEERRRAWWNVLSGALVAAGSVALLMTQLSSDKFWHRAEFAVAVVTIASVLVTWRDHRVKVSLLFRKPTKEIPGPRPGPELPLPAAGASGRQMAEWVDRKRFSTTRLRSGYDEEEVDLLLDKISGTFLGTASVPVRRWEVTTAHFTRTRTRPGYNEQEVDTFLADVGLRLT